MTTAGIRVASLNHSYGSDAHKVHALSDIDLAIDQGQFVALLGSSGCGKTTLLDILSGLTPMQNGQVTLAGSHPEAGRQDVARMFSRDALLPWRSAAGNIDFALATREPDPDIRRARIDELLVSVGLEQFRDAYPSQLSQGMRQRVALARTFSLRSPFVLLDEPFGALDALTKITLQNLLIELWSGASGTTVVLVTHDIGEAVALADRVIVMSARPGRIAADITVGLERPRDVRQLQESRDYHELVSQLWHELDS
ncbi:MAG: ABC transporter ATP-binding protein [Gammaproteobacteria bacterium]|nr:ABC transporter ATP-binding protein [Gammaproteobacteria bacterium]